MAGQRTSLASLASTKVEDVPGRGSVTLSTLPLASIAPTPLNPRTNFGSSEELADLGRSIKRRQLQPIVVVTKALYLKHFPEHAEQIDGESASYVIAVGERRYRAAGAAGLGTIEAAIRDEVAATRQDFVDAVLSENLDRKNFDPIEEAEAIELLVREFGSARAAAAHRGKTESWVSQRRSLLRLAEPVRVLVRARELPVEAARTLAKAVKDHKLDDQQQLDWWAAKQLAAASAQDDTPGQDVPPDSPNATTKPGRGSGSATKASPAPRKQVPHQASPPKAAERNSDSEFAAYANQPRELAAALAAQLTADELVVLVEELHAFV